MSVADVVYNHIEKAKVDKIETIEIRPSELDINIVKQFFCKTADKTFSNEIKKGEAEKKAKFNSIVLMPYFIKESEKWAKDIGINIKYWSETEHERFKTYFMDKYKGMIK